MRLTLLVLLLVGIITTCYSQQVVIHPTIPVVEIPLPNSTTLSVSSVLTCGIQLTTEEFNTEWRTPNDDVIGATGATGSNALGVKFAIQNGAVSTFPHGTLLSVMTLIYTDSGNYTCSVTLTNGTTFSANVGLSLVVLTRAITTPVSPLDGATSITLNCEMAYYIHSDTDFQWMRGGQRITPGDKYAITYSKGNSNRGQMGGIELIPSRLSSLLINNVDSSDGGNYKCFVEGTDKASNLQLNINRSTTSAATGTPTTGTTTMGSNDTSALQGISFPLPAVGGIAAFLFLIVVVLIILIVVVSVRKRRKTSIVVTTTNIDTLNENTAYESSSNGGALMHGVSPPKYARIEKPSLSPAPPLPARPSTNLSLSARNSPNPSYDYDRTPPGYESTAIISSSEKSTMIDPYYDNPDDIKPPPIPKVPRKNRSYYDEISLGESSPFSPRDEPTYSLASVPSPAVILSGSLQRNVMDPIPDFSYPSFNEDMNGNGEHDYDQIYSEPLNPTMLSHEYEIESINDVAIPYSAIYEDPQPLQDSSSPLRVTENSIVEIKQLGMGQFGNVLLARTVGLSMKDLKFSDTDSDPNKSTLVAIKKLRIDADGCLLEAFEKEVKFMARLNHDNVIRLLGVCTGDNESFIMMEYMENGDLNQFLQKQMLMPDTISGIQENMVTPIILLYIGVQMASGMHYLGSHRFVHRDFATRNCLVGRDFIVKVSDFGMSRSLYESAYYRVQGTLVLPIRWMACETFYGKFSVKSDAWAFAVALWEIYTLGKVDPYDSMSDEEIIADAIRGPDRLILSKPPNCPQEVYDIMLRCWVHEPSMRADFGEIYSRLFMIYTRQAL